MTDEFKEIAHSGGKITFCIRTTDEGARSYQIQYSSSRPVPMVMTGVYALPDGIPVETLHLGGIGQPWNQPPIDGCLPVLLSSDSHGRFGHSCPRCSSYWRSGPFPEVCPYCFLQAPSHNFLSEAQQSYVRHYCKVLTSAMDTESNADVIIDMDEVADAAGTDTQKPEFYVSEESQQCKFTCTACGEFNDIIGRYGYCSVCGTRNDLHDFESNSIQQIRDQLNTNVPPEICLKSAVSSFDSFVSQVAQQLAQMVPMTKQRHKRLTRQRFHDLKDTSETLQNWFDIEMLSGVSQSDINFLTKMFCRRHVHEHNSGVVDQKYIDDSNDTSVQIRQHIHESKGDIHKLLGLLVKMARNVHTTFHQLFPPLHEPVQRYAKGQTRRAR